VWALQQGKTLYVGGRTNRAQVAFEREVLDMLDALSDAPHPAAAEA
jgi:cytochrome c biogenesis protein